MCGVFAYLKTTPERFSEGVKAKIKSDLHHRGPDSSGTFEDESIFLLHTRLEIIDLSSSANQPFISSDGRYSLVFNGEIYNYKELKKILESAGVDFRTDSDTEVILMSFVKWGERFVEKLTGMFSIILYDIQKRMTYIYRDRLGIKPLYMSKVDNHFIFSSEVQLLTQFQKAKLNNQATWSYFNLRYTQGDKTLFENIEEVTPGTYLVF